MASLEWYTLQKLRRYTSIVVATLGICLLTAVSVLVLIQTTYSTSPLDLLTQNAQIPDRLLAVPSHNLSVDHELFEIEGPYDGGPLREKCDEIVWQPGLYFDCSQNSGGIGNMRAFMLTCIRYAMESGASLVMPTIRKRDEKHRSDLFTDRRPFSYMFDQDHFTEAMEEYCPQMKLVNSLHALPATLHKVEHTIVPKGLANLGKHDGTGLDGVNRYAGTFRTDFDEWLVVGAKHKPTINSPIIVNLKWPTFFEWPVTIDGARFANTFGRLLRFRADVRLLAATVLEEMARQFPETADEVGAHKLLNFTGVHLRADSDALSWWPNEQDQVDDAMHQIAGHEQRFVYLATGTTSSFLHMQDRAATELNATTLSKDTLLSESGTQLLEALEWDQRGLVDYLVLLRSAWFAGMSASSFSMNVAARRHLLTKGIDSLTWRGVEDGYSHLYGPRKSYLKNWVYFVEEAMWP